VFGGVARVAQSVVIGVQFLAGVRFFLYHHIQNWCEIWGFHGSEDSGWGLLGCDAV